MEYKQIPIGQAENISGKQFNRLKALYRVEHPTGRKGVFWLCECQCEAKTLLVVSKNHLTSDHTKSCGCLKHENKGGGRPVRDLTGQIFGELAVLSLAKVENGHAFWNCKCSCGKMHTVMGSSLTTGDTKSCGFCKPRHFIDLTNQKFGLLTALEPTEKRVGSYVVWKCLCDCGNYTEVPSGYLTIGQTKSCGCLGASYNETKITQMLQEADISFTSQKNFKDCLLASGAKARFDFYIEDSYIIEFDGQQHFSYRKDTINTWNTKEHFKETRNNDLLKNKYCFEHNIPLIRIPYDREYDLNDLKLETTRFLLTKENEEEYYQRK